MFENLVQKSVRARAPLRIGLAGGGTDLSQYCNEHGGVVLNATIDRYAYAHLGTRDDGRIVFRADDLGVVDELPCTMNFDIRQGLPLHRATYAHMMNVYNGGEPMPLEITTTIDVPAGSGLGASSALTVALIEAFVEAMSLPFGPYDIAELAFDIERVRLGMLGGRQDQYAAAFGGLNFIEFLRGGATVVVNPLRMHRNILNEFESSLVICFSGQSRDSARIIEDQVSGLRSLDESMLEAMHQLKLQAVEMKRLLLHGDFRGSADIMREAWQSKKNTASTVTNNRIDALLDIAMEKGGWGGKVSGAGGGGFIMLLADPARRHQLIEALNSSGGNASGVRLTFEGVEAWGVPE